MPNIFVIECKYSNLAKLRHYMENSLKENSIDDTVSFQLVMAVDELCANIIEHSCTQKPDDFIQIELKKQKNQVVIKIIDKGNSFDPKEHCPLSVKDLIKKKANGGLGLRIVSKFIDKIEYEVKNKLNICTLYKNIVLK
ncbi:MAG: ATP-binding protein [Cytophagales bacterium]